MSRLNFVARASRTVISVIAVAMLCAALIGCSGEQAEPPLLTVPEPEPAAAGASAGAAASAINVESVAEPEPAPQFESGQSWTLRSASLASLSESAAGIFIEVQDGRLVGYGGCNRFSVPMSRGEGGALKFDAVVASKRACGSDALNSAERDFLQSLAAVTAFDIEQGELQLRSADGASLNFSPGRPKDAEPASE